MVCIHLGVQVWEFCLQYGTKPALIAISRSTSVVEVISVVVRATCSGKVPLLRHGHVRVPYPYPIACRKRVEARCHWRSQAERATK